MPAASAMAGTTMKQLVAVVSVVVVIVMIALAVAVAFALVSTMGLNP